MTLTKEWLLKTISELEEERDAIPGAVNEDAAMALEAMKLALESLEAEAVSVFKIDHESSLIKHVKNVVSENNAPPAPVVPDERAAFNTWNNETDCPLAGRDAKTDAWLAWSRGAAMLQGAAGNSPAIPDDVRRMDWLVSKTVDVREPMVYGSHSLFWSQTITDEEDDYHATKLREQIDAAMAAENAAAPQ
ncbi:hypothetical protein [Escherichia coli]|uniref:hypothetical protein n=1 Tax=Escherichia coli TaxID=562 RepID=UPI003F57C3EC